MDDDADPRIGFHPAPSATTGGGSMPRHDCGSPGRVEPADGAHARAVSKRLLKAACRARARSVTSRRRCSSWADPYPPSRRPAATAFVGAGIVRPRCAAATARSTSRAAGGEAPAGAIGMSPFRSPAPRGREEQSGRPRARSPFWRLRGRGVRLGGSPALASACARHAAQQSGSPRAAPRAEPGQRDLGARRDRAASADQRTVGRDRGQDGRVPSFVDDRHRSSEQARGNPP